MAERDRLEQRETTEDTHMADLPPYPDSNGDTGVGTGREYPGIPRWVKVSVIIVIGLVLLVVVVLLVATALGIHTPPGGPGGHGPGRDTPSSDAGSQTPLSSVIEDHISSSGGLGSHTPPSSVTKHGVQRL